MKKLLIAITLILSLVLSSCSAPPSPRDLLTDVTRICGASGIFLLSDAAENEDGYADPALLDRIYVTAADLPTDFAILLNDRPGFGAECGVFLCRDSSSRRRAELVLRERMSLIDPDGDCSLLLRSGLILFYSTLPDPDRVKSVWDSVL